MRTFFLIVVGLCLALFPVAAFAGGIALDTAVRYEFTDCSSGGSASQAITTTTDRTFILRVTDKDTFICYAATCATGGEKMPLGTVMLLTVQKSTTMSCRSSDSTGDLILTRAY